MSWWCLMVWCVSRLRGHHRRGSDDRLVAVGATVEFEASRQWVGSQAGCPVPPWRVLTAHSAVPSACALRTLTRLPRRCRQLRLSPGRLDTPWHAVFTAVKPLRYWITAVYKHWCQLYRDVKDAVMFEGPGLMMGHFLACWTSCVWMHYWLTPSICVMVLGGSWLWVTTAPHTSIESQFIMQYFSGLFYMSTGLDGVLLI